MAKKSVARPRTDATKKTALDHALAYAAEGIPVIWIPARSKAPIAKGWPSLATTDAATIRQWGVEHPGCNFGMVMGDGFIAIDVDDPGRLPELEELGFELPETRVHRTANGLHFLYRVPDTVKIKNVVKKFGIVDVRHAGAQVVGPGSTHPSGAVYTIDHDVEIADLPAHSLKMLQEPERAAPAKASTSERRISAGSRNTILTSLAGVMRRRGVGEDVILEALRAENRNCEPPLDDRELQTIARSVSNYPPDAGIQATLNDERPKVLLPGENRLMSECAAELGGYLFDKLYLHNGEVVTLDGDVLAPVSVQAFRTLVERTVVCCKMRSAGRNNGVVQVGVTMSEGDSRGILASQHFKERLRPLKRFNTCRLPVYREDGRVELLPEGYDHESQTLTVSTVEYDDGLSFSEGMSILKDLLGEFNFNDDGRSKAVAVSSLMGLYAGHLVPEGELRPAFAFTKNAEGAGATTLAACAIVPVLGHMPTGTKSDDESEMRKRITACVREGRRVLMLDNAKGLINSASLEALLTSPVWSDRLLGSTENIVGPNLATVFITSNGTTISPDLRRRTLFCELHLSVERAEDKTYKRPLSVPVLQAMRPQILAACWSVVRNWDAKSRPDASRGHSSFPAWARVIGGIVEAAGFKCPLATADVSIVADEDGAAMRALVGAMGKKNYSSQEIAALCRRLGVFTQLVGDSETSMQPSHRSAFGKMLARYSDRTIGRFKFTIEGNFRFRRFQAVEVIAEEVGQGVKVGKGVSPRASNKHTKRTLGYRPCPTFHLDRDDIGKPKPKPRKFEREYRRKKPLNTGTA